MSEEQMAALMREFVKLIGRPDLDKPLSYLTDDVTWETPEATFRGKAEIKRYLGWLAKSWPDLAITECGVGIVAQGSRAAFEHMMQGTYQGTLCRWLGLCTYEFAGDKIKAIRTVVDRLSILKQGAKGFLQAPVVNMLVNRAEKGLH